MRSPQDAVSSSWHPRTCDPAASANRELDSTDSSSVMEDRTARPSNKSSPLVAASVELTQGTPVTSDAEVPAGIHVRVAEYMSQPSEEVTARRAWTINDGWTASQGLDAMPFSEPVRAVTVIAEEATSIPQQPPLLQEQLGDQPSKRERIFVREEPPMSPADAAAGSPPRTESKESIADSVAQSLQTLLTVEQMSTPSLAQTAPTMQPNLAGHATLQGALVVVREMELVIGKALELCRAERDRIDASLTDPIRRAEKDFSGR